MCKASIRLYEAETGSYSLCKEAVETLYMMNAIHDAIYDAIYVAIYIYINKNRFSPA